MNKVELMGRLTKDTEVRYTQVNNTLVATFTLAVNRRFARKEDEVKADFFQIVAWGKVGEFASKYFKKGQQVAVIGRLQSRHYEDKDGKTVYVTEVIAEEVYFADSKKDDVSNNNETTVPNNDEQYTNPFHQVDDDDLPF